ncbi:MAG TPA: hypothetical protein VJV78_45710 [Polyangiales bacterium]|nr:hypothetical protein [Polyangiales bacterium]
MAAILAVIGCWFAAPADAQTCHAPSLREPTDNGFHVGVLQMFAVFSDTESGDYQGLIATLGFRHDWVEAELILPAYRLAEDGREDIGLGDVAADARVAVVRTENFSFGPELAASFPTGDADRDLGMGHVMLMPGAWARLDLERFGVLAQLAYGAALGEHDHGEHQNHEHHEAVSGATPRVNPMNTSELEHAIGLRYALDPALSVTARWFGGVPLKAAGVARQILAPGLQLAAGTLDAALEAQFPLAGDPFDFRLTVAFGSRF